MSGRRAGGRNGYRLRLPKSNPPGLNHSILTGTLLDALDGALAAAFGHANCKRGEQLISGGERQRSGAEGFVAGHVSLIEQGPVPDKREYVAKWSSDLGGAARNDFVVFAVCLP